MALIQPRTPRVTSHIAEQRVHEWAIHMDAERRRHEEASKKGCPDTFTRTWPFRVKRGRVERWSRGVWPSC